MRPLRVAVAGLGVVGSETVRLLRQRGREFKRRLGTSIELAAVCDRHAREKARRLGLPASVRRLTDPRKISSLPDVDIVVELLGGVPEPRRLVSAALRSGRSVVTANKMLLAHAWTELRAAQAQGQGRLRFEASVAGGVPVLRAIDSSLAADRIFSVYGILNGTTNFILTRMGEGIDAAAALRLAQERGLAERDPSRDLEGHDAADKVSVLASLITNSWVKPSQVSTQGIRAIESEDAAFAENTLGRRPRLLGVINLDGTRGRIETFVCPCLVPLSHPLASVRDEFNAVVVSAASAGELMFHGKGAGAGPTASAVLGDIVETGREILSQARPDPARPAAPAPAHYESKCAFYLRLSVMDRPAALRSIAAVLKRFDVSIATTNQPAGRGQAATVILTTRPAEPKNFQRSLRALLGLPGVSRKHTAMRVLL